MGAEIAQGKAKILTGNCTTGVVQLAVLSSIARLIGCIPYR